jgi:hypothetical protein
MARLINPNVKLTDLNFAVRVAELAALIAVFNFLGIVLGSMAWACSLNPDAESYAPAIVGGFMALVFLVASAAIAIGLVLEIFARYSLDDDMEKPPCYTTGTLSDPLPYANSVDTASI